MKNPWLSREQASVSISIKAAVILNSNTFVRPQSLLQLEDPQNILMNSRAHDRKALETVVLTTYTGSGLRQKPA
jgi:hypothetical protein